jgi:PAS domain-containing protein
MWSREIQWPFKPNSRISSGSTNSLAKNDARVELKLDGAYVGLFEWNIVANASKWSTGFYLLHGLEAGGSASYELWRQQVHPEGIDRVVAELQRAVAEAGQVDTDYRIFHPTGELRWTNLKAAVRADADGNPDLMAGYCGDITRRKLADAALLETHKLAITRQMSAAIGHEINNPLEAAYNLL